MIELEGEALKAQFVAHAALNAHAEPFCVGFRGAKKCHVIWVSSAQSNMAFGVNSVPRSETIMRGLRGCSIRASVRALSAVSRSKFLEPRMAFLPDDVDDVQNANRRPQADWTSTKFSDQRALGLV